MTCLFIHTKSALPNSTLQETVLLTIWSTRVAEFTNTLQISMPCMCLNIIRAKSQSGPKPKSQIYVILLPI